MNNSFNLTTPAFEGPLEALLNLIEDRKLSISQINLAEVCDAYLAYVEKLPQMPLGETAQFILVASTLLLIKSRALLPTLDLSSDERESVEELERRLAHLALIRRGARLLRHSWGRVPLVLARASPSRPVTFGPGEAGQGTIIDAAQRILRTLPKPTDLARAVVAPVLALEDVVRNVHARLTSALKARFSELTRSSDRGEVIVYFLAMLELVRAGSASVSQEKLFADITIELENAAVPRYGA